MAITSRLILLFLLFVFSSIGQAQDAELEMVLDRLVHTYGGETNLRRMDSMVQQWDMVALMGNRRGTDSRSVRAPGKLRVVLDYGEKSETRILNDGTGHYIFSGTSPVAVNGMQLDAMQLQLMRLYSPLMLRNKIDSISLIENGKSLALSLAERGVQVHYLVNLETWRIEKVAGVLTINGREIQFLTEYSDFEFAEGVLIHRKENKYASGVNTAVLQLRQIIFNARLDDSLFRP